MIPKRNYNALPAALELVAAGSLVMRPDLFLLSPGAALLLAGAVAKLGLFRGYQALRVVRHRRLMACTASFAIAAEELPAHRDRVYLGRGFLWQNRHVSELCRLKEERDLTGYLGSETGSGGLPFIHGVGMAAEEDIYLGAPELNGHTVIAGTTRVGKTRLLELLIAQAVRRGEVVIVVDPKGDNDLLDRVHAECVACGREDDFLFFSLVYPQQSVTYNPLHNFLKATDIASRITSTMPMDPRNRPFTDFAWKVITTVTDALMALDERPTLRLIHRCSLKETPELVKRLEEKLNAHAFTSTGKRRHLEEAFGNMKLQADHPGEHFQKMITSLEPVLTSLTYGEVGELLSAESPQMTWEKVIRRGKVVYLYLGGMIDRQVALSVARMAVQDLLFYTGYMYAFGEAGAPVNLFVDEFYNVVFEGFVDLLNKAGGAGIRATLALQTTSDIESVVSPARARQILGNCNTKIFMRVVEREIAENFSDLFGETLIRMRGWKKGETPEVHEGGGLLYRSSYSEEEKLQKEPLVSPDLLMSLPKGQAFVYSQGRMPLKVRLPLIAGEPEGRFTRRLGIGA